MKPTEELLPPRYELLKELGAGATSRVFLCHDRDAGRDVAVKLLVDERLSERFLREASCLSRLKHPNLVEFFFVGSYLGREYFVMEYLPGGDLRSALLGKGIKDILDAYMALCAGLAHLHGHGIIHRDVKPSNVLFDDQGIPKLVDLGLSRDLGQEVRLTQPGLILGTGAYLAPEQITSGDAGAAADLYALGICFFESLTGQRPFLAQSEFELLQAHLKEPPPKLSTLRPDLPESLTQLTSSLLEKQPGNRPTNAKVVIAMLERCRIDLAGPLGASQNRRDSELIFVSCSENERTLILGMAYLAETMSFSEVCAVSPFAEDRTEALLETLIKARAVTESPRGVFSLGAIRLDLISRLTPRLEALYEARLRQAGLGTNGIKKRSTTKGWGLKEQGGLGDGLAAVQPSKVKPRWLVWLALLAIVTLLGVGGKNLFALPWTLQVSSEPSGAQVFLDGHLLGKTPLVTEVTSWGTHTVRATRPGYLSESQIVGFWPWQKLGLSFVLEENFGYLRLRGIPKGARLSINGAFYDPREAGNLQVLVGKVIVRIEQEGFRPFVQEVVISSGQLTEIPVELSASSLDSK